MKFDRRMLLTSGMVVGAGMAASPAGASSPARNRRITGENTVPAAELGLTPDLATEQTSRLQAAIDQAASRRQPLLLPAGRYSIGAITLRPGTRLIGSGPGTVLQYSGGGALVVGDSAHDAAIEALAIDGNMKPLDPAHAQGLVTLRNCRNLLISELHVRGSLINGIALAGCSGRIENCRIHDVGRTGLFSIDAAGLEITHNTVTDCRNNGIQVWRSAKGEDGTIIAGNRIERVAAVLGGSGEYGNGINVFRAAGVLITGNRIADCAYSAIRGNAASNIQMVANNCVRLGEVGLYAEFGFEGALIASNLVDTAAMGISVTNFNDGGRLAVIQGNLVRNLFRREHERQDKRGEGIGVEADASVTGNTIENAPTAGIMIGWGRHMRDVAATGNVIRNTRVGIAVTAEPPAGSCLIAQNLISGAKEGAVRGHERGRLVGNDLTIAPPKSSRIVVAGNLSTSAAG